MFPLNMGYDALKDLAAALKIRDRDIVKKKKRLAVVQKRAAELEKPIYKIYEDCILGKPPESRYAALDE